jgi:hypothetical protein
MNEYLWSIFKRCSTLEEELTEARRELAQLQEGREPSPPNIKQDDSSSETIRLLNHVSIGSAHDAPVDIF